MQATININDDLLAQAITITAINDNNKLIEMALRELIANHQPEKTDHLLDLFGAGGIKQDYDYKKHRCNPI